MRATPLLFCALLALPAACEKPADSRESPPPAPAATESSTPAKDAFLFLGDSLTAGYGVAGNEAYPSLLAAQWEARRLPWKVRNAGVSGSTSKGVLENIDWNLAEDVRVVFLAIGANDGLRGQDLAETRRNIEAVIDACRDRGARVVLAGMKLPPNYGDEYAGAFERMYADIASAKGVKFLPFLLEGVAARPELNIADGIHPNAAGHKIMARNVGRFLEEEGLLE